MDTFKDILPSIMISKKDLSQEEGFEKAYNSFIILRALSFHYDCVMFANEMNMLPGTDKKMQFQFLLNTVRGYKRPFQKWQKRESVEALDIVKEYYSFSNEKAKEALAVLTDDQIDELRTKLDRGGAKHRTKKA